MKRKYKVIWRHPESTDIEEYIEAENVDELEKILGDIQAVEAYAGSASDVDWIEKEEISLCELCQRAYEPDEMNGVRKLKTFNGFTVDLRLQQFRKVPYGKLPEFIDFVSPKGQELLSQMHNSAIELANTRIKRMQKSK